MFETGLAKLMRAGFRWNVPLWVGAYILILHHGQGFCIQRTGKGLEAVQGKGKGHQGARGSKGRSCCRQWIQLVQDCIGQGCRAR